jgi:hypothetical protein
MAGVHTLRTYVRAHVGISGEDGSEQLCQNSCHKYESCSLRPWVLTRWIGELLRKYVQSRANRVDRPKG